MAVEQDKRILIVDDEGDVRGLLSSLLRRQFLNVEEAGSPDEAVEKLRENRYSVVLLDLLMPGGGGKAVLDYLGEIPEAVAPVVLIVTGADRQTLEDLDPQRIHGIVRKPFDPAEVAALVRACADIRSRNNMGTMAIAMIAGTPLLALLSTKL